MPQLSDQAMDMDRNLKSWLVNKSNKKFNPDTCHLSIYNFPTTGFGLKAEKDFEPDQILFKLPIDSCSVNVKNVLEDPNIQKFLNSPNLPHDHYNAMDLLIIFFIIGRKKFPNLEKSNFEPYFQFLPQSFSTLPFTWNADQIDYFDTFDRSDVYQEIDLVEETFKKIKSALEASKLFTKYYELSKSDFLWAFSIIRTRSFSCCALRNYELPQDLRNRNKNYQNLVLGSYKRQILMPYIDMVNHANDDKDVNVDVDLDVDDNWIIFSTRFIKKGQQLFLNYDPFSSAETLLCHGFIDTSRPNPNERISFSIPEIDANNAIHSRLKNTNLDFVTSKDLPSGENPMFINFNSGCSFGLQKAALICSLDNSLELGSKCQSWADVYWGYYSTIPKYIKEKTNEKLKEIILQKKKMLLNKLADIEFEIQQVKDNLCDIQENDGFYWLKILFKTQIKFIEEFLKSSNNKFFVLPCDSDYVAGCSEDESEKNSSTCPYGNPSVRSTSSSSLAKKIRESFASQRSSMSQFRRSTSVLSGGNVNVNSKNSNDSTEVFSGEVEINSSDRFRSKNEMILGYEFLY